MSECEHVWRTDGQHSNEFCAKCFVSKPAGYSLNCPQCGCKTDQLCEGHCAECCADNQVALDLHNAQHDEWQRLTDQQRDARIRDAVRRA